MRPLSSLLLSLLNFGCLIAADQWPDVRINIEVRDESGNPLSGYLILKDPPQKLNYDPYDKEEVTRRYYQYFERYEEGALRVGVPGGAFLTELKDGVWIRDGKLSLSRSWILDSEMKALAPGRLLFAFFFWDGASEDKTTAREIGDSAKKVTWWTLHLSESRTSAGIGLKQIVTVREKERWTESPSIRFVEGRGADETGYFPGHREQQAFVLEPPIDSFGQLISTPAKPPVLLVHGINGTANAWDPADATLRGKGMQVWGLYYGMGQENLSDSGEMLGLALRQIGASYRAEPFVDVVAHSYGGVVARRMLHTDPKTRKYIRRLLMISPPHHGSFSAYKVQTQDPFALAQRYGIFGDLYLDPYAPVYADLTPGSQALLELERSPYRFDEFKEPSNGRAVLVLAGRKPIIHVLAIFNEAPGHDDGIVSISSASLLDLEVPLWTINLDHGEEPKDALTVDVIERFLDVLDKVADAPTVSRNLQDLDAPRAGILADLGDYTPCAGPAGSVLLSGATTKAGTKYSKNLISVPGGGFFYQDGDKVSGSTVAFPGMAFLMSDPYEQDVTLAITCQNSVVVEEHLKLRHARTAIFTRGWSSLQGIALSSNSVVGGDSVTGTVNLTRPAPWELTITLESSSERVTVPDKVTVAAWQDSAQFTVTTNAVPAIHDAVIKATLGGDSKTATLTINPASSGGGTGPISGLVGWWTFETADISGNTALDKSGQGNHGRIYGATPTSGKIGQALQFDGNSYVQATTKGMPIGNADRTLAGWVKLDAKEGFFFGYGGFETFNACYVLYTPSPPASPVLGVTQWGQSVGTGGALLTTNLWYHVAAVTTRDGTTVTYLNGSQYRSGSMTFNTTTNSNDFYLGGLVKDISYAGVSRLKGAIDDVRIYNRALSAAEISELYNSAGSGGGGTPVGIEFVPIPAGEFVMGCSTGDTNCSAAEKPPHLVRIAKPFEMGKYEVTQTQWQTVMGNNPSQFSGPNMPVTLVTWPAVQDFMNRLNARNDGYRYRLPTEAEWEYAARAGTTGPYYGKLDDIAWYKSNSGGRTHDVGQRQPNAWGLYDMIGNAWEWCQDWWDAGYYATSPAADPPGPTSGTYRVLRGCSWDYEANLAIAEGGSGHFRVSARTRGEPNYALAGGYGFRCVRERIP